MARIWMKIHRKEKMMIIRAVLHITVLFFIGCASLSGGGVTPWAVPTTAKVLRDVPFYPQEKYQCGPASLAAVLNYYREAPDPEAIAEAIFDPKRRGTLSLDLALYTRERGFDARWYSGGPTDLIHQIDKGRPLLVLVDLGFGPIRRPHFMVAIGYSPQGVIAHSGIQKNRFIAWNTFISRWERGEFWTLLVKPREDQ